jgi:uncharacterized protein YyaL (SSP411 family)
MVVRTLEHMARGGIYDHVGGGFHRYATDDGWLVPHFEKMLYDNALLTVAYLEGYQATGRADFADVARDVLRYVRREMTSADGAFYSATDADSEGEEGRFFVWTPAELTEALGAERARIVAAYYGVTEAGNFDGASVLHVARPADAVAADLQLPAADVRSVIAAAREELYDARARRVPPLTDRKIQASWNGLMISAFARAAQVLRDEREAHVDAAVRAARFILSRMRTDGRLRHSWFEGQLTADGFLDDYAFVGAALLDLYEATGDAHWLEEVVALHDVLEAHYWDRDGGGFFMTADDGEVLLAREKPNYDGAEPSGNAVALLNLLRLHELTTNDRYRQRAETGLLALGGMITRAPVTVPKLLGALDFRLDRAKAVVIVESRDAGGGGSSAPLMDTVARLFVPNRVLAVVSAGADHRRLAPLVPLVVDKVPQNDRATAYVCENRVCTLPTSDPDVLARQLSTVLPLPAS